MCEDQIAPPTLRIAGFGACMIGGYPHQEAGFFEIACREIGRAAGVRVETTVCSLGGFPAPRALKYLRPKIFAFKPDYVVIQLAALDALCPVRQDGSSGAGSSVRSIARKSGSQAMPASVWSYSRWSLAGLLGYLRAMEPVTPLPEYLAAMAQMMGASRDVV